MSVDRATANAVHDSAAGRRQAWAFVLLCVLVAIAAYLLRPTIEIAVFQGQALERAVPEQFGDWRIDRSIRPVIPDPSTLAYINEIYSETVARTYVNRQGQRVMLSLAYGRRQNDTMRVHRPEGCYAGQGFAVSRIGEQQVRVDGRSLAVMRLNTSLGMRREPVSYWMVVGGTHAISQTQAKLAQLHYGLRGYVPDGLLFRVSSIDADPAAGFALQDIFIRDLIAAVAPQVARGLTGT